VRCVAGSVRGIGLFLWTKPSALNYADSSCHTREIAHLDELRLQRMDSLESLQHSSITSTFIRLRTPILEVAEWQFLGGVLPVLAVSTRICRTSLEAIPQKCVRFS
jgi:hypothetical protein